MGEEGDCKVQEEDHIHMSPGVYKDVSTGCFSSQALLATPSVPQADTIIYLSQHSSLIFPLLTT